MINSKEVEVGDFFLIENDHKDRIVVRVTKKMGSDYYEFSDGVIHSCDELMPLACYYLDINSHPDLAAAMVMETAEWSADGSNLIPLRKNAHIVQHSMRDKYGVEYELNFENLKKGQIKYE